MRIVDQVDRNTCIAKRAHVSTFAGTAYRPTIVGQCEDSSSLVGSRPGSEGPASRDGSLQSLSEPDASQRPIARAMSRLMTLLIEGFAAYGEALSPTLIYPGELIDDEELEQTAQPRWQAQDERRSKMPWPDASPPRKLEDSARSAKSQTASPGWSARITSFAARVWSRIRHERRVWLTVTSLEALDDRTLDDIGMHRSQIGSIARREDRYEP